MSSEMKNGAEEELAPIGDDTLQRILAAFSVRARTWLVASTFWKTCSMVA